MSIPNRKTIGILGGTFDPIHFGHLRAAIEVYEQLNLDELRLIPCKLPPHKGTPIADPNHRLNMAHLATQGTDLTVDNCEVQRGSPSYSLDTLRALRQAYPEASLWMMIGTDALMNLPTWHQWEKIIQFTNIIVLHRRGWTIPTNGIIGAFLKKYALAANEDVNIFTAGRVKEQEITQLDISSTKIRSLIQEGLSPDFLIPTPVWEYIQTHALYGYTRR